MRKWTILLVFVVFLAACNGANGQQKDGDQGDSDSVEEKADKPSEDTDEESEKDETAEDEKQQEDEETEEVANMEENQTKEPQYQVTGNWSFEPIGDANPKVALVTIDDAPDEHAVSMAQTLKDMDAPAIFFANGHFINTDEGKEKLKKIHEMGFPIGNHTESHASLPDLTKEQQKQEIVGLNDKIEKIIGERPKFFRAPFGQNTDYSKQLAAEENMLVMNWTYGYDWNEEYMDAKKLTDIMVNTELLNNGANLLMHDRDWTSKALPNIVKGLRGKGYELLDPALIKTP